MRIIFFTNYVGQIFLVLLLCTVSVLAIDPAAKFEQLPLSVYYKLNDKLSPQIKPMLENGNIDEPSLLKSTQDAASEILGTSAFAFSLAGDSVKPLNDTLSNIGKYTAYLDALQKLYQGNINSSAMSLTKTILTDEISQWLSGGGWAGYGFALAGWYEYVLSSIGNTAISGRYERWRDAYFNYYEHSKRKGGFKRSLWEWKKDLQGCHSKKEVMAKINSYLNHFWDDDMRWSYLRKGYALTKGNIAREPLEKEKKLICQAYMKERLIPYLKPMIRYESEKSAQKAAVKSISKMIAILNHIHHLHIEVKKGDTPVENALVKIGEWEWHTDSNGVLDIDYTLYGYMLNGTPRKIEVFSEDRIKKEKKFDLEQGRVVIDFAGEKSLPINIPYDLWLPPKYFPKGFQLDKYGSKIYHNPLGSNGSESIDVKLNVPKYNGGTEKETWITVFIDDFRVFKNQKEAKKFIVFYNQNVELIPYNFKYDAYIKKDFGNPCKDFYSRSGPAKLEMRKLMLSFVRIKNIYFHIRVVSQLIEGYHDNIIKRPISCAQQIKIAEVFSDRILQYAQDQGWIVDPIESSAYNTDKKEKQSGTVRIPKNIPKNKISQTKKSSKEISNRFNLMGIGAHAELTGIKIRDTKKTQNEEQKAQEIINRFGVD